MSTDKHYDGWDKRIVDSARPFGWRDLLWIVAKGVAIGTVVVIVARLL